MPEQNQPPSQTKHLLLELYDHDENYLPVADFIGLDLSASDIARIKSLHKTMQDIGAIEIAEREEQAQFLYHDPEDPTNQTPLLPFSGKMDLVWRKVSIYGYRVFWQGYYKNTSVQWISESVSLEELSDFEPYDSLEHHLPTKPE